MFPYDVSGRTDGYFPRRPVGYGGFFDMEDNLPAYVETDVNMFIDKSKDFVAKLTKGKLWVADMGSLDNMVGHFGYGVMKSDVGYSPTGEVSDIPCCSTDGCKRPIHLKSALDIVNLHYETLIPGKNRVFKLVGMKIGQIEEIGYGHSTVVLSPNEAFPKFEEAKLNKFSEVTMSLGKISDDMDIVDLKREDATKYIYK
jgi:hypothetical protein